MAALLRRCGLLLSVVTFDEIFNFLSEFDDEPTVPACLPTSVTRLGDLLHFGQLFKACGNNYFA